MLSRTGGRFMTRRPRFVVLSLAALIGVVSLSAQAPQQASPQPPGRQALEIAYSPARGSWETRKPADMGMDEALLSQAIEYAKTRDTNWGKADYMADQVRTFGRPMGPVPPAHGRTNGIVIRHGYI